MKAKKADTAMSTYKNNQLNNIRIKGVMQNVKR